MSRKKRIRSPHPGVVLHYRTLPSGRKVCRARYVDPDTGRTKDVTLDSLALSNQEARRDWAIRKAKQIAFRRMELDLGAPTPTQTPIGSALGQYYESRKMVLSESTVTNYKLTTVELEAWARKRGVTYVEELGKRHLIELRDHFIALQHRAPQAGGKRGQRKVLARTRSIASVNRDMCQLKAVLNDFRRRELLPRLDRDAISDCLKKLPEPRRKLTFLSPSQCRELLEAALRHDAEHFTLTRAEHDGLGAPGQTPRYRPIAPFVAFLLLAGCRLGEAENLRWDYCDLGAKDYDGRVQGEIDLPAELTKVSRARTVLLDVCPQLRQVLAALKLKAGKSAYVFGGEEPMTRDESAAARRRMRTEFGAPAFGWQKLRRTCGTFLTNAPGIFGSASVFRSAAQLGHSVAVAEKHYLGVTRDIPWDARTLEAAMQIEDVMARVVEAVSGSQMVGATIAIPRL